MLVPSFLQGQQATLCFGSLLAQAAHWFWQLPGSRLAAAATSSTRYSTAGCMADLHALQPISWAQSKAYGRLRGFFDLMQTEVRVEAFQSCNRDPVYASPVTSLE